MTADFTAEEQARLAPFFTNLDRSTFGLKLPQEVAGALFSRYSRSTKSLRRTFLDEFLGDPELGLKDLLGGQSAASDDSAALKKGAGLLRARAGRLRRRFRGAIGRRASRVRKYFQRRRQAARRRAHRHRAAGEIDALRALRSEGRGGNYLFYREPKIMASRHRDAYLEVDESAVRHLLAADGADVGVDCQGAAHRATGGARSDDAAKRWRTPTPRTTTGCGVGRRPLIAPPCARTLATCCAVICRQRR